MIQLTVKEAQRYLVTYQGLDHYSTGNPKKLTLELFETIGSIQYDPLNVVGRNPDLVLQSRIKSYTPSILNDLLYKDRKLVDGWDKMLSIYSITDFSKFEIVRQAMGEDIEKILKHRNSSASLEIIDPVLNFLKSNGPTQASEMDFGSGGTGVWGHRKLSSATLDYLFHLGKVGVYNKKNTQKIYDLIENLFPSELITTDSSFETTESFMTWYVHRRIRSIGLIWNKNGGGWLGHFICKKTLRTPAIDTLVNNGALLECRIEHSNDIFYIPAEGLNILENIRSKKTTPKQVKFIAPLDNLLWDRDMIEQLFNFKYRWEVYTPIIKREFGYYVLPVLYGHTFIGRIEFEQQRLSDPLVIKNWWLEPSVSPSKTIQIALHKALKIFARYCGSDTIEGLELIDKTFKQ